MSLPYEQDLTLNVPQTDADGNPIEDPNNPGKQFFIENVGYLVTDRYMRGGFRIAEAATTVLGAAGKNEYLYYSPVSPLNGKYWRRNKPGMILVTPEADGTFRWWQMQPDKKTWKELFIPTSQNPNITVTAPLALDANNNLTIDTHYTLPAGSFPQSVLYADGNGNLTWIASSTLGGGGGTTLARQVKAFPAALAAPVPIDPGATYDFNLEMARTLLLLKLSVSVPCKIEAFTTPDRTDANPYKFLAEIGHLVDEGISRLDDGSLVYNRRFGILSNLETDTASLTKKYIFWRVTNNASTIIYPTIEFLYLPLE